jgi:dipeptidyl aminopeptidase/acylaminoacyl peptidase
MRADISLGLSMHNKTIMKNSAPVALLVLLCVVLAFPLPASPAGASGRQGKIDASQPGVLSPEQTLRRFQITDLQLSPDETRIAMSVTEPIKGTDRRSNIWILDTGSRSLQRFTTSGKSDRRPRWSPDGKKLAFISNRDGTAQILLMPATGGEAEALTDSKTPISDFEWSPDGATIAYLSADPKTEEQEKKLKERDDAVVIDKAEKAARLRIIDVESRKVEVLTRDLLRISEVVWMPSGDRLLLSATDHPRRDLFSNRLYLLSAKGGDPKAIETPLGPFSNLDVSPDGATLAYLGARSADGPDPHDLWVRPLEGGNAVNLTGSSIDRPIVSFRRRTDGRFLAIASTGFTTTFHNVTRTGEVEALGRFAVHPGGSFVAGSGLLAFVGETTTRAPELWVSNSLAAAEQVTHFNKEWDGIPLLPIEIVRYRSFDGKEIEAALLKPAGYKQGARVPFVVLVHGGPASLFGDRFHAWSQLLVARGYAVILPNIRGSLGYGHDFLISNRYDWGGGDWKDVLAAVDYAIGQGIADPERLGVGGWSYGGYMAAWAVTQTNRFKASVSGAPMTDLASEFGTESPGVNVGDTWALRTPYENLDLFIKRSPVTFVKNAKTPTLILNGEEDLTDPIGQAQQFYRGLTRYGVDAEFVMYPRMGHGPSEEKHQIDVLNRMIAWFEKHLK